MSDSFPADLQFLNQLKEVIARNLANEQFGVTELAEEMNMSRSNLLRRVKKSVSIPVNQLIREARLKRAMELLQSSSLTISEVSHQVGFNSPSYFIKCFREHYGYPPGETGKRNINQSSDGAEHQEKTGREKKKFLFAVFIGFVIVLAAGGVFYLFNMPASTKAERSIIILPFKNESNDSTNVYLINGLMESTLSNLQKIGDLRVLSRTSSERYRNTTKSISEITNDLGVNYLIEGSGQKIGDQILLNIQLIDGKSDKHLWAKQYRREGKDIFALQQEIAKDIAGEIEVVISPEAEQRIEKIPTENLEAYDYFLKGREQFYNISGANLHKAKTYLEKAIDLDPRFGSAYAHLAMVEYYLDIFQIEKHYTKEISELAEKAMLYDAKSAESLIAKALAYAYVKDYKSSVPYLERALEYDPHSSLLFHFLTEFYSLFVPDPKKYVEYALRGAHEERVTMDTATACFKYFHVSNALMQAGFLDDGIKYVDQVMSYDSNHYFARYVGILFHYTKNDDLELTRKLLVKEFNEDTTRIDIVKELARICYSLKDYDASYHYFNTFITLKKRYSMEIYDEDNITIAYVFAQKGMKEISAEYLNTFKKFADTNESIYKHLFLSSYYAYVGNTGKSIAELKLFSKEDKFQYWVLLLESDPVMEPVTSHPEFKRVMDQIKKNFWARNENMKKEFRSKGLYPFEDYVSLMPGR